MSGMPLAVSLHVHWLEQARARPAGAQAAQLMFERRMRGLHSAFKFGEIKLRQLRHMCHTNRRPPRGANKTA